MRSDEISVIAPNLKKRWSGVTSTVFRLVPVQKSQIGIACTGPNLPPELPKITLIGLIFMRARKPRIWHARRNTEMLAGLALKWILRKNLKLVFTSAAQRAHSRYTRWLIRRMDAVVATSAKAGAFLQVPHRVIMHGVDCDRFRPAAHKRDVKEALGLPADHCLIGCFGRIRHQKGTDRFVEIMMRQVKRHSDVTAVITGGTTVDNRGFEDDLSGRVTRAGMAGRIQFLGEQPDGRVPEFFRAMDIFVAPQRAEGFGLTPLEAMASGVPVVATRAGAFEEMIEDGQTGLIVDTEDDEGLEAAIEELIAAPERRAAMARAARAHVLDNFALETEATALTALYRSLLDDGGENGDDEGQHDG
ncbi:glycosyltransferase family 4 protein [Marinibacterium profundimaris]|uniref:glycosyltransferase family 4 protein n=1 Tax=Marinibacterium profundimaris TaxID=1679460 RepID=UPI000B521FE4|nr:glycosyltransferase family 4 protein [Marinibacterium profundimaris]